MRKNVTGQGFFGFYQYKGFESPPEVTIKK
jgi:hypothetical protein